MSPEAGAASGVRLIKAQGPAKITEQEAEAKLRQEGYEVFRWHDVPGSSYPRHRHEYHECLWVIEGEISFTVESQDYSLHAGDRLYLPARMPHTAIVPGSGGCTYLVGQRKA